MTSGYVCKECGAESPVGIGYVGQPERDSPREGCGHPHVVDAWELIGAEGRFRIQGGRTVYEEVMDYRGIGDRTQVRLARLETAGRQLRQINRWVDADTRIEVLPLVGTR